MIKVPPSRVLAAAAVVIVLVVVALVVRCPPSILPTFSRGGPPPPLPPYPHPNTPPSLPSSLLPCTATTGGNSECVCVCWREGVRRLLSCCCGAARHGEGRQMAQPPNRSSSEERDETIVLGMSDNDLLFPLSSMRLLHCHHLVVFKLLLPMLLLFIHYTTTK